MSFLHKKNFSFNASRCLILYIHSIKWGGEFFYAVTFGRIKKHSLLGIIEVD